MELVDTHGRRNQDAFRRDARASSATRDVSDGVVERCRTVELSDRMLTRRQGGELQSRNRR